MFDAPRDDLLWSRCFQPAAGGGKFFEQLRSRFQSMKSRSRPRQPSGAISWRFDDSVIEHDQLQRAGRRSWSCSITLSSKRHEIAPEGCRGLERDFIDWKRLRSSSK